MVSSVYIPHVFRWPTPWLWLGILGIVVLSSNGFWEALSRIAMVLIVASAVYFFGGRKHVGAVHEQRASDGELDQRLAEIERRLTDTQDVMIALSEKVDCWEDEFRARRSGRSNASTTASVEAGHGG